MYIFSKCSQSRESLSHSVIATLLPHPSPLVSPQYTPTSQWVSLFFNLSLKGIREIWLNIIAFDLIVLVLFAQRSNIIGMPAWDKFSSTPRKLISHWLWAEIIIVYFPLLVSSVNTVMAERKINEDRKRRDMPKKQVYKCKLLVKNENKSLNG